MRKRSIYTALWLLLMQCCLLSPFQANAGIEDKNVRIEGSTLLALSPLSVTDDKFTNTPGWNNGMLNVLAKNRIEFGFDESHKVFHSAFTSTISFSYTYIDEQLVTQGPFTESLVVTYNPLAGTTYKDKAILNFSGGYKVDVTINSITTLDGSGNPIANPSDLYLEAGISANRYYTFSQSTVPTISTMGYNLPAGTNEMEVYWDVIPGAEEYDLEWTFVDNYNGTGGPPLLASILTYDFKNNATRITTQNNYYRIPLIYEGGYILFRVRGVGRSLVDVTKRLEGKWSSEDPSTSSSGIVGNYPAQKRYTVTAHLDDNLNWSRVATFAEEGKQGNGISYMDGILRPHQSVAVLNSEKKTIVQSTLYDHNGRPAIGVLPAPVNRPDLTYNPNLNMYSAGTPYDKDIFDIDNGCVTTVPPMDNVNSNGAAKYYSPNNPDKEGMQGLIPDAEGFPFVQVEYTPDMTGRIRRQTMPGSTHELNSGKEMQYFYAQPSQDELDRLFGSEAGYAKHYKKNAVVDANGQVSVSYIDMRGNVVATALAGAKPANLDAIAGSTDAYPVSENLLAGEGNSNDEYTLNTDRTIMVTAPNTVYTFHYEITTEDYTDNCAPGLCLDCIYELEISIKDECGNEMIDLDGTGPLLPAAIDVVVGGIAPYNTTCDNPTITYTLPNSPLAITFPKVGTYTIHKTLKVSDAPIPYYLEQYLATDTCIQTLEDFEQAALATIDFSGCGYTCDQCTTALQAYITKTTPGQPGYDPSLLPITQDQADALMADCQELCEPMDPCASLKGSMLHDFYPGQQYAGYTVGVSGYSSTDPLSIFTTGNSLGITWSSSSLNYTDANGNPALVTNSAGQQVSPNQLTMVEFIQMFQPSWAEALAVHHPEYCYYQFCVANSSSENYDLAMMETMSYDEACAAGYLEPLPQLAWGACPQVTDPFFGTGGFGNADQAAFANSLLSYGGGLSIYQLAVQQVTGSSSTHAFGSDPCTKDAEWRVFRALYMTKKLAYVDRYRMDHAMGNGCYNGCIGDPSFSSSDDNFDCYNLNIIPACFLQANNYDGSEDFTQPCHNSTWSYYTNKQKRFISPSQALGFDPFTGTPSSSQTNFAAVNCQPTCEGYADQWMLTLASCGMTTTQYNDIRAGLIAVCMGGCDTDNPMGASTSPSPVGAGSFTSFQDVLTYYLGSNGNTMSCNALMISAPKPYVNTAVTGDPSYPMLDTCGCDKILTSADKFAQLQTAGTLPDGVDTEEEYFQYAYGFSLTDYAGMECKCLSVANTTWTPEYTWTSADAAELDAMEIAVPYGMQCEYCLPCSEVTYAYDAFLTSHPGWETSAAFTTIITTHLNNTFGMTLSYLDYINFLDACEEFQASQEQCSDHLTAAARSFADFLNELATDGTLTSSFTMTPVNTTTFFNSNLYPYSGTQVSYSASISGNTLTVTLSDATQRPPFECQFTLNFPSGSTYNWDNIIGFSSIASNLGTGSCGWQRDFTITAQVRAGEEIINVQMAGTTCYNIVDCSCDGAPQLCNRKGLTAQVENDCMQSLIDQALTDAQESYDTYLEGIVYSFVNEYKAKCFAIQHEEFEMEYTLNEYHYTLYYYDRAGNLSKTVPPNGVTILTPTQVDQVQLVRANGGTRIYNNSNANTGYITTYKYNSLNQATENSTPDEDGATVYFYDRIGRIVASQNHKQLVSGNVYSYIVYDELSRIREVGEITSFTSLTPTVTGDAAALASFISVGTKIQVTRTFYDTPINGTFGQQHLRNRVAAVTFQKVWNASASVYDQATHYSYDEHGNADHIIQDNQQLAHFGQQYKHIRYEYDLISGNVIKVSYQENEPDQFYHKYAYDADNRLKEVYTSRDGEIWEKDAKYFFQQQGALGRVELGDVQVQGMDFAYTIQGWIKGMNSNILSSKNDMGKDGATGNGYISTISDVHANFGEDVAGFSLSYFNNDYKSIKTFAAADHFIASTAGVTGTGNAFDLASDAPELFNGNITGMVTSIMDPTTRNKLPQITSYKYDQLHRLKQMKAYSDITANAWNNGVSYNDSYFMSLTYDPNGNIQTMTRKGASGTALAMDVLTYKYITVANGFSENRNQLTHVDDAVAGSVYTDDLEDQSSGNYDYDEIGQLAKDDKECIANIEWTPYRKVKKVSRTNGCMVNGSYPADLEFEYNAQLQRIMKLVKPRDGSGNLLPEDQWVYTYYSYDASGNVMAIYERKYNSTGTNAWEDRLNVKAFELYASSHIGTYGYTSAYQVAAVPFTATVSGGVFTSRVNSAAVTTTVDDTHLARTLGNRMYQLANHLGNILSTVADRKLQVDGNSDNLVDNYLADVLSSTDYYPFGQEMPGRTFSSNKYRYGYNGMEKDDEMGKGSGNSYTTEFRMYDPRIGRWLSQDPIVHEWESPYAAFANNPIFYADPSGLDGEGPNGECPGDMRTNSDGTIQFYLENGTWTTPSQMLGKEGEVEVIGHAKTDQQKVLEIVTDEYERMKFGLKYLEMWYENAEVFWEFDLSVDYGQHIEGELNLLGAGIGVEANAGSIEFIGFTATQAGSSDNPWDVDFNYYNKDSRQANSHGGGASFIVGYNYEKSWTSAVGDKNRDVEDHQTTHSISGAVANLEITKDHETGLHSRRLYGQVGAGVIALMGVNVSVSYGLQDKAPVDFDKEMKQVLEEYLEENK